MNCFTREKISSPSSSFRLQPSYLLFSSGKVIISGVKTEEEINV